eukprot:c694_g1_i1.p1 GENE.c694_g1_i1~~c694_g1_i1.p1  ORF type:complete len:581 (+),score=179.52 c694_g1_i1:48-1745(+)
MATPVPLSVASLYVGDLSPEITEALLFEIFSRYGPVSSIRVCRDYTTRRSLGYAYVNFQNHGDAERALNTFNFEPIRGYPCRIMWSSRDPTIRKSALGNLFVKNLDPSIDNKTLFDTFSQYGNILSCKVALDRNMKSKGFGFVHFDAEKSAKECIEKLNGKLMNGKVVYVAEFQRKSNRAANNSQFTNLYVKFIPQEWTKEDFHRTFSQFGVIKSADLRMDPTGQRQHSGFGFVNYNQHEEALKAIEEGKKIQVGDERYLFVTRFQTNEERKAILDKQISEFKRQNYERFKGKNLHVKNLDEDVTEEELEKVFSQYGAISSLKIERDEKKVSKCFGYVCFNQPENAKTAMEQLNMAVLDGRSKPIHVALHQTKEERKVLLDTQHQMNTAMRQMQPYPTMMFPPVPTSIPQYVTQPQRQNFAPQSQMINPTRGYSSNMMNVRGARGGMARGGSSSRGVYANQGQRSTRRPDSDVSVPLQQRPVNGGDPLVAALAKASPEEQKHMLGERLFPLVYKEQPQHAAKITGMILELEVQELLSYLEAPDQLRKKVQEAVRVLEEYSRNAPQ